MEIKIPFCVHVPVITSNKIFLLTKLYIIIILDSGFLQNACKSLYSPFIYPHSVVKTCLSITICLIKNWPNYEIL